jgi:hypothetical protein
MTSSSSSNAKSDIDRRKAYVAKCIAAAAREIDVETCTIKNRMVNASDPYELGLYEFHPDANECLEQLLFVTANGIGCWVLAADLPPNKYNELQDRIARANKIPTTAEGVRDILLEEYRRDVANLLDGVIHDAVENRLQKVPRNIVLCGVRLALSDLGKQSTPQEARIMRRYSAGDGDPESKLDLVERL